MRRATKPPRPREEMLEVTHPSHHRGDTMAAEPPPADPIHHPLVGLGYSSSLQAVTPCSFHKAGMLSKHDNLEKLQT